MRCMIRIGITGQSGFVGTHLAKCVQENPNFKLIPYEDRFFGDDALLRAFVRQCDVIVHLAGVSRRPDGDEAALYATNMGINARLISLMDAEMVAPHVIFASSVHETRDTAYGRSKRDGCLLFSNWAKERGVPFSCLVFPNIYGPGARPFYCSFIANFAYQLQHGEEPQIQVDAAIDLIYIKNLCRFLLAQIDNPRNEKIYVPKDATMNVSEVLAIFRAFVKVDLDSTMFTGVQKNLYETFASYKNFVL